MHSEYVGFILSVLFPQCSTRIHLSITDATYSQQLTASVNNTYISKFMWELERQERNKPMKNRMREGEEKNLAEVKDSVFRFYQRLRQSAFLIG